MPEQADESYIIEILIESSKAIKNAQKIEDMTEQIKNQLKSMADQSGKSIGNLVEGIKKGEGTVEELGQAFGKLSDEDLRLFQVALRNAKNEMRDTGDISTDLKDTISSSLGSVATIAGVVFNAINKAQQALRKFISTLREGIDAAGDFSLDMARLNVNLRAFQRTGGDLTASELLPFMEELRETYKVFSEQDMVNATQALLHWGRQLDLTGEQTLDLLEVSTKLSLITGQELPAAIRQVTTAAITGRTQSLRPYGIALDGTKIKHRALNRDLIETGEELDNNTKLLIILEEANRVLSETLGEETEILDTLGGSQREVEVGWIDLKKALGELFAPEVKVVNDLLSGLYDTLLKVTDAIKRFNVRLLAGLSIQAQVIKNLDDVVTGQFDFFDRYRKEVDRFTDLVFPEKTLGDGVKKFFQEGVDAAEEGSADLLEKFEGLGIKIRELLIDEQDDIEDQWEKHFERLVEMGLRFDEKREQNRIKYEGDIAAINRKFNDELEEANEEFREKELDREEDFQDKLKKLREDFLLDLEDALRERDAKQVLSLIRRFKLREKQLKRQEDIEKKQRERRFQDRVQDIERQRQIRLRETRIEFEERRRLTRRDYDLRRRLEERNHQERLENIREETQERKEELIRRFEDEHDITKSGAKKVRDVLQEYFGSGGEVDKIYDHLISKSVTTADKVRQAVGTIAQYINSLREMQVGGLEPLTGPGGSYFSTPNGYAEGGTVIADRPTTVTFGEGREPEMATFSPIGRIGRDEGKVFGELEGSGKMSKQIIELFLSDDLVAKTRNNVFNDMAEVVIKQNRR